MGGPDTVPVQCQYKNKDQAATMIGRLQVAAKKLIEYMVHTYPRDPRVARLVANYSDEAMMEGRPDPDNDNTSYVIRKGDKIVMCLRDNKDESKIEAYNTLIFVLVHEMSHLASLSYGHGREFQTNFKFLLDAAVKDKVYVPVDYRLRPVSFCGLHIDQSPLRFTNSGQYVPSSS